MTPYSTLPLVVPTLPHAGDLQRHLCDLDEHGWTVLPGFLDGRTTSRLREHMDSIAAPVRRADEPAECRLHDLRHPISGDIMAEMLTDQHVELGKQLLHGNDLRLTEQVLIRTDPSPELAEPIGWHIDFAFYPRHYCARPRQTYVQMVHALSTVGNGGGAVMVVPGSHKTNYLAAETISQNGERFAMMDQESFKAEIMASANVDTSAGIEILAEEGDLMLFNPMCVHSASRNKSKNSRYVMFMSFFDVSAKELNDCFNHIGYRDRFPDSLKNQLSPHLRTLLNKEG